jgi:hypothetical protein
MITRSISIPFNKFARGRRLPGKTLVLWGLYLSAVTLAPFIALNLSVNAARMSGPITHDGGLAYVMNVPKLSHLADSEAAPMTSPIVVCEDRQPLGPAHVYPHNEIRMAGTGRFSHWGSSVVFSTSDRSDPTANSRRYWLSFDGECTSSRASVLASLVASCWPLTKCRRDPPPEKPAIVHEGGLGYTMTVPDLRNLADTDEEPIRSPVLVCENYRALGPAHTRSHGEVRYSGAGRFSHSGDYVVFSTSDRSDPTTNGRRYWLSLEGSCDLIEVARWYPQISHEEGWAYIIRVPKLLSVADTPDAPERSPVVVCKHDHQVGPGHSRLDDVRKLGGGRFSHRGEHILFSTPDNSDATRPSEKYWLSLNGQCATPTMGRLRHHLGLGYLVELPQLSPLADTDDAPAKSPAVVCENNQALSPAHTYPHDNIRDLGSGRLSHRGHQMLFSTTDKSDALTNSKRYSISLDGKCDLHHR